MRVAAVQHDIVWEDAEATRDRVRPLIAAAADEGARLIVLS
jgi:predicted amidohydrolase